MSSQIIDLEIGSFLALDGQPLVTGQTLTLTETDPVEWWEQIVKLGDPAVQEMICFDMCRDSHNYPYL